MSGGGPSRSSAVTGTAAPLAVAFVLLVGLSGGLVAVQGDAEPAVIGAAVLGGTVAGAALFRYLRWIATD
jgi:hypothetical protein